MPRKTLIALLALGALLTQPLVASAQPPRNDPDVNNDTVVNILDISLVVGCLGHDPASDSACSEPDTDHDGDVDMDDFRWVVSHFGQTGFATGDGVAVPALAGLDQQAATQALDGAGLITGAIERVFDATTPAGIVNGQDPAAGAFVDAGAEVRVRISRGAPPPQLTITEPAPMAVVATASVTIRGTVSDPGASVQVHTAPDQPGQAVTLNGNAFTHPGVVLEEGLNTIVVSAVDGNGIGSSRLIHVLRRTPLPVQPPLDFVVDPTVVPPAGSITGMRACGSMRRSSKPTSSAPS